MSIANAAHCSMMGGGNALPYTPCDCVGSDGYGYVLIPHTHINSNSLRIETKYKTVNSIQYDKNFFGGADSSDQNGVTCYKHPGGTAVLVQLYGPTRYYDSLDLHELTDGSYNNLKFTFDATTSPARVFELNGATKSSNNYSYVAAIKMAVFTQTKGNSAMTRRVSQTYGVQTFKYWDGDILVADLIACKDTEGVGYFYNKVDGTRLYSTVSNHQLVAYD